MLIHTHTHTHDNWLHLWELHCSQDDDQTGLTMITPMGWFLSLKISLLGPLNIGFLATYMCFMFTMDPRKDIFFHSPQHLLWKLSMSIFFSTICFHWLLWVYLLGFNPSVIGRFSGLCALLQEKRQLKVDTKRPFGEN